MTNSSVIGLRPPQRACADEARAADRHVDERDVGPVADAAPAVRTRAAGRSAPGRSRRSPWRGRRRSSRAGPGTRCWCRWRWRRSGSRRRPWRRRGACRRRRARRSPRRSRSRIARVAASESWAEPSSRSGSSSSSERTFARAQVAVQRRREAVGGGQHQHAVDSRRAQSAHQPVDHRGLVGVAEDRRARHQAADVPPGGGVGDDADGRHARENPTPGRVAAALRGSYADRWVVTRDPFIAIDAGTDVRAHARSLRRVWESAFEGGSLRPRAVIEQSWARMQRAGLDPERLQPQSGARRGRARRRRARTARSPASCRCCAATWARWPTTRSTCSSSATRPAGSCGSKGTSASRRTPSSGSASARGCCGPRTAWARTRSGPRWRSITPSRSSRPSTSWPSSTAGGARRRRSTIPVSGRAARRRGHLRAAAHRAPAQPRAGQRGGGHGRGRAALPPRRRRGAPARGVPGAHGDARPPPQRDGRSRRARADRPARGLGRRGARGAGGRRDGRRCPTGARRWPSRSRAAVRCCGARPGARGPSTAGAAAGAARPPGAERADRHAGAADVERPPGRDPRAARRCIPTG